MWYGKTAMIEVVVFDCFGTLVDVERGAYFNNKRVGAFSLLQAETPEITYDDFQTAWGNNFARLDFEARKSFREFTMTELVEEVQNDLGTNADTPAVIDAYLEEWLLGIHAIKDINNMLGVLKESKKLAILSNTHYEGIVQGALAVAGIEPDIFDIIKTSVEYGMRKPDPAIMNSLLLESGVQPEQVLMVGDSYHDDFGVASRGGTYCLLVNSAQNSGGTFQPGNFVVLNSVLEVPSYVS
jgi:putative hydrolase of the HAD superfamily